MKKLVLLLIIGGAAAAAFNQFQPAQMSALDTYLGYHQTVAAGRSFEDDAAYYTAAKRAEVMAQIDSAEDSEDLKAAYLDFTQKQASCSQLALSEETHNGETTRLVFNVTDTCDTYEAGTKVQEIVEMIQEGGLWKIAANETSISQ